MLMFLGDTQAREQIVFWQLGSLNGSRWQLRRRRRPVRRRRRRASHWPAPAASTCWPSASAPARHLGVHVERLRIGLIVVVALLTAAAVCVLRDRRVRRPGRPPPRPHGHRARPPAACIAGVPGRRQPRARRRRPRRAHARRLRRPAARHAHLARRRPLLLLAASGAPVVRPGAGHEVTDVPSALARPSCRCGRHRRLRLAPRARRRRPRPARGRGARAGRSQRRRQVDPARRRRRRPAARLRHRHRARPARPASGGSRGPGPRAGRC